MLFYLKSGLDFTVVAVFFGMTDSTIGKIVKEMFTFIIQTYGHVISENFNNRTNYLHVKFPDSYVCVDCTEVPVQRQRGCFSGKKKFYTIKYQVLICRGSGKVIHVTGPFIGKVHDSNIFYLSKIGDIFFELKEGILSDLGYLGCLSCVTPIKDYGGLTIANLEYNYVQSQERVSVERFFALLKKWNILKSPYKGDISNHYNLFLTCCILLSIGEI